MNGSLLLNCILCTVYSNSIIHLIIHTAITISISAADLLSTLIKFFSYSVSNNSVTLCMTSYHEDNDDSNTNSVMMQRGTGT